MSGKPEAQLLYPLESLGSRTMISYGTCGGCPFYLSILEPLYVAQPHKLRKEIRAKRRALSLLEQHRHSSAMATLLCNSALYRNSNRIALYLQIDGEIDPSPVIAAANRHHKNAICRYYGHTFNMVYGSLNSAVANSYNLTVLV